jgi:tetratricopeptide (TPR) repeat protein
MDSSDTPPVDQSAPSKPTEQPNAADFVATEAQEPLARTGSYPTHGEPAAESDAPTVPELPGVPAAPQYPPAPQQYLTPPGQPPAGSPGQPSGPYSGPYPGPYPGQPPYPYPAPDTQPRYDYQYEAQGSQPLYGQLAVLGAQVPPRREPPQWLRSLARPFPIWITLVAILVTLAVFGGLALLGNDWAQSALFIGLAAGAVFLFVATLTIVRSIGGMGGAQNTHRLRQYVSSGLALFLLLGLFGASFVLQTPLHRAQAASFEGQKQWQLALTEYRQAGETAPASNDLARVYNEWAEQSTAQGEYSAAIDFFSSVLKTYPGATSQVARAKTGIVATYIAWGKAALDSKDYQSATQRLDILLALDYCDSGCQTTAGAADATAYYNLAEAALATQAYDVAVDKFHSLVTRFPSSPEAPQAHADLAKSLLGLGQKQRTGVCSQAIPTYQELSTKFADTPEGQAATAELAQPQPVIGRFTKAIPGGAYAILAKGMYHNMPHNEFISKVSYPAPRVHVNADGSFRFNAIAQGTWDLVWATVNANGENYIFAYRSSDGLSYFQAQVGPLCAYDLGSIDEDFPPGL